MILINDVYKNYKNLTFGIAMHQFNFSYEDAEDIHNEVCLKVYLSQHKFIGKYKAHSLSAWIKIIILNTCVNYLKRRRRDYLLSEIQENTLTDERVNIEKNIIEKNQFELMERCIDQLGENEKRVLDLVRQNYTQSKIAFLLNISQATVSRQRTLAVMKVRNRVHMAA